MQRVGLSAGTWLGLVTLAALTLCVLYVLVQREKQAYRHQRLVEEWGIPD